MSNEAQAVRAKIEAALKEGTRPGVWSFGSYASGVLVTDDENGKHWPIAVTGDCAIPWASPPDNEDAYKTASYMVAVQPANIRTLLDDHDEKLRAANERIDVLTAALAGMVEIAELTVGWFPTPPGADGPLIVARAALATNQDTQPTRTRNQPGHATNQDTQS